MRFSEPLLLLEISPAVQAPSPSRASWFCCSLFVSLLLLPIMMLPLTGVAAEDGASTTCGPGDDGGHCPLRPAPPTSAEHLAEALRRDMSRWKPGRVVPQEFNWASTLPECSDSHVCPGPDWFCCAVDFPHGMAGKLYRPDMCCPRTPTTCPTRTKHKTHCLMCNRIEWEGECPLEGCVAALPVASANLIVEQVYAEYEALGTRERYVDEQAP